MEQTITPPNSRLTQKNFSAPNVIRLRDLIVNSYLISETNGTWCLVDAGMSPGHAEKIFQVAAQHFGAESKPAAIFLTHGHFDHVGSLKNLLRRWNVPVYAHRLEMPYLTGRASYPPADPTAGGGLMTRLSPLFPTTGIDVGNQVQTLPGDNSIPLMPSWKWIHTPGHTAGHVSFFRESDRTLIVGDAFVTVKNESAIAILFQKQKVNRPPSSFTTDWEQARQSVEKLADLRPTYAATGHGIPMHGNQLREQLNDLAANFSGIMPKDGRYVREPAVADANGIRFLPPPISDPLPKMMGIIAALTIGICVSRKIGKRKTRRS
ncbi:MAG: MBL fold metallo-hydrolase [Verrucomicrobiota bacterium]